MIKIVLAAVLVTLSLAQNAQKADNIEYLSLGYNIYLGDPLAGSIDPGFCFSTIFNLTYINNDISFDGKYLEPDMVTVAAESSCVLNSAASAVTSTSSYLNSVNAFASVDAGCPFGSFSASTTYKTVTQTTNDKSTFYTLSTGQCSVYVADITLDGFPQLTEAFLENAVKYLGDSESGMHYQFLSGYGTHYLKSVTMGSRLSVMNQLSAESWNSLQSQDISITAAAQASFMGAYAGFSAGASTSNTQVQAYDTSSSSFQEATIGSLPVGNANAAEWAQQAITNPMPIQYELAPISDLFNSQINSNLPTSIESATLDTILSNLNAALNGGYCQYLLSEGSVTSCSAVPDENNTPAPAVGSCVLCASGCGGLYSEPQAIFDVYQEQADWFMYYSPYCSQTTTLNIDGYSGGVDMCCIPETPGTLQGSCKMCTSCGGSFSYSEGSMWDGDQGLINLGWFQTYGDSCEGNLQADANPPAGYDLCCDQPGVCAFCATCGGEYAYETGVIANTDVSQPTAFGFYGPQCYGAWPGYGEEAGPNGFQLCCSHFSSS